MRRPMWLVALAVGLIGSLLASAGLAAEGEEGGNNLSTPVVFAEGIGLAGTQVDPLDYTTTGFPGLVKCDGVEQWGGTDGAPYVIAYQVTGTDPTVYQLMIDGHQYLDPLEGTDTATPGQYYLQPYTLDGDPFGMDTCWEADWVDGTATDMVEVNALDTGDSLVRVLRSEGTNPIRVEFGPYQVTETAGTFQDGILLDGYPMTQLWPPAFSDGQPPSVGDGERQEVWATAKSSDGGPTAADRASVYSANARLTIDRLTWEALPESFADGDLDGYPTGVVPGTFEAGYDSWVASTDYDGVVGGAEGESGFSAEVNQAGNTLYGYNWGLGAVVESGWYRITFSIDPSVDGVDANTTITGLDPDDVLADESDGGPPGGQGSKGFFPPNLVEDATNGNYVFVDVYIAPDSPSGNGKMTGKVQNGLGSDLGGITVTVFDQSGTPVGGTHTSGDGTYQVNVEPGTYNLGFTDDDAIYLDTYHAGHMTLGEADDVVVTDGGTTVVDATLPFFRDVGASHPFAADILWMKETGISTGWPDGTFRPALDVTRQAMSAFMYRAAGEPMFTPPAVATFSDVPTTHPFFTEIEWMAAEGISTGWPDGTFRPAEDVTRQAMSAFMYRAAGEPAFEPVSQTFVDVPTTHPFYTEIEWMADEGISTGWTDGTFRPNQDVTRQAMSAFMHRAAE